MWLSFLYLCFQTLFFWTLLIYLYRQKERLTLVPLYCYLAVMTVFTHNLSDLGFTVVFNQWYFFVGSFSFFTTVLLGVLFIYLLEGPRATRLAFYIILGVSFLYILIVILMNLEVGVTNWVVVNSRLFVVYFWSIFALVVDVFLLSVVWELLERQTRIPLIIRVFLVTSFVYSIDTIIFVSGAFGGQVQYLALLKSNLTIRLFLALATTFVASYYLKEQGYSNISRRKSKNLWEILNFRSDLEDKLISVEAAIHEEQSLRKKLSETQKTYELALEGVDAGIWDWDIVADSIKYSPKFCSMLGYQESELPETVDAFRSLIHPEDIDSTYQKISDATSGKTKYSTHFRLKKKSGDYRWYQSGGVVKFDSDSKPIRMVGSIIDIDDKISLSIVAEDKVSQLEKLNKIMVGRELQMIKLKQRIHELENSGGQQ